MRAMRGRRNVLIAFAAALAAFFVLVAWRGFLPQHAAMVGIAIGALVYSTFGTAERLRASYRRQGPRSIRRSDEE